jgi:TorA maturation chaperone TorD
MYATTQSPTEAVDAAREMLYLFLAMSLRPPVQTAANLRNEATLTTVRAAADLLRHEALNDAVVLAPGEESPEALDLAAATVWWEIPPDDLFAEYDRVFGLGGGDCPSYETEFCPNREPFYRAQQMADVAGFYRAFGIKETRDRPDSLALELEFMAFLLAKEREASESDDDTIADDRRGICRSTQWQFLRDHLIWWVPSFASRIRRKAAVGPFAAIAGALAAFIATERARFNLQAPISRARPRPTDQPGPSEGCGGCTSAN